MKINKKRLSIITIVILIISITVITISAFVIYSKQKNGNEAAAIQLYKDLIDTMAEDITESDEYISIEFGRVLDPLNKKTLSKQAKDEILNYCKKYKDIVYNKTAEELVSSGLGEDGKLDGILIKLNITSVSYNKATISVSYYKANLGAGGISYTVKYKNNKWELSNIVNRWMS